mmetsp:Transcript_46175/g.67439  ORF Transcript_46175/g.67439 Transcript_46175/m.67439 type:complete len:411 (+) Transcript_46175:295-1527(+)
MVAAKHKAIRRGAPQAFPRKLYDLINVEPDSIISWSDLGDSFYLHDQPKFIADVLPRHFRHNHFSSFQRQLNLYGFKRVASGPEQGAYTHNLFHRSQPELLDSIKRTPQWSAAKERRKQLAMENKTAHDEDQPSDRSKRKTSYDAVESTPYPAIPEEFNESSRVKIVEPQYDLAYQGYPSHNPHHFDVGGLPPPMIQPTPIFQSYAHPYPSNIAGHPQPILPEPAPHANIMAPPVPPQPPQPSDGLILSKLQEEPEEDWALQEFTEFFSPSSADLKGAVQRRKADLSDPTSLLSKDSSSWADDYVKQEEAGPVPYHDDDNKENTTSSNGPEMEPLTPSLDELVIINNLCESVNSFDIRNFRKATLTRAISTSSDLGVTEIARCSSAADLCSTQSRRSEKDLSAFFRNRRC